MTGRLLASTLINTLCRPDRARSCSCMLQELSLAGQTQLLLLLLLETRVLALVTCLSPDTFEAAHTALLLLLLLLLLLCICLVNIYVVNNTPDKLHVLQCLSCQHCLRPACLSQL